MSSTVETRTARTGDPSGKPARKLQPGTLAKIVLLAVVALIFISPVIFMIVTSFKTRAEATSIPPSWIPDPFSLEAYQTLLAPGTNTPVLRWFFNSMVAAILHSALVVVTASLAAYPLARMNFRGKKIVFAIIVATLLVPPVILVIPNYLLVSDLGWLNSLVAIIVPTAASAFGVFFMRQFFISLPDDLEEAARIDGANRFQMFTRIILPLAKPAMATLALLAFLGNWNDFLWPVYVLFTPEVQTLPPGLGTLQSANAVRYDLLMAGAVVASVPVLALFVFLQRFIIEGVSRSGVKG
ncbi:carbohydrate ABC transporter permease [Arthrobacter sp. TMS1-12-1]